ncbi:MAG: diaminobutyrate--2-oxoglutarate transaminase [Deltaproteobacteria bacterium]|nr:diaminobutyrate--2-oxoglutarate transaminase [Kofleriaceae bacterium]
METIERLESEVRTYCRTFPTVFTRARGVWLEDDQGKRYLDFFAGAGALNYGHNHPVLKQALLEYLTDDGVVHSLDMATGAKIRFLEAFERRVLRPRDLSYKVMFPGPTGTNAVEAALKLARKVTGRTTVVSFTNAFHGMTLGSLAVTGNATKRRAAGVPLTNVVRAPFDGYLGADTDSIAYLESLFADGSSGVDAPAAFLLETVQAEGGVNVARTPWLRALADLARRLGALLVVDDIQVGCGRTGGFFSFEEAGITPDIVCLSKSLSGYGLPLAITLLRRELDAWQPGEHNGTFRGHNPAFVTAAAALEHFWSDATLTRAVEERSAAARERLTRLAGPCNAEVRGRGLILGLACADPSLARRISTHAFAQGLIIETAGADDHVVKLLTPLTIQPDELAEGLDRLERAVGLALDESPGDRQSRRRLQAVAS